MGLTQSIDRIIVRRRGGVDSVTIDDKDGGDRVSNYGNRRTRQIAKRHWVLKVNDYFDSHGSDHAGLSAAIKPPGKEEQKIATPSYQE